MRYAAALLQVAACSIGDRAALEEDQWELRHLLDSYEAAQRVISDTDTRMAALPEHIPCADLVRSVGMALPQAAALIPPFGLVGHSLEDDALTSLIYRCT